MPSLRRLAVTVLGALTLATAVSLPAVTPVAAASGFSDVAPGSQFDADITWLAQQGITLGCGDGRFCPGDAVTREQMASFLARMFALPVAAADYFTDDAASPHQNDINRLATSGITNGCGPSAFCPSRAVTRAEMASFLTRAGSLAATSNDYFLDDESSVHEDAINRMAATGITRGCSVSALYCPEAVVTREQMAAFLHRLATGGGPAPTPLGAGAPPACSYQDVLTARTGYANWNTSVLDTIYMLPSSYYPGDLVDTANAGLNGGYSVRSLVISDLSAMRAAAAAAGAPIAVQSAFRSYATQASTFNYWVSVDGYARALVTSARAGHSEHQLGTALDFRSANGGAPWDLADWAATPAGAWMAANAWQYGFVMSYPAGKQSVTCYDYEPWHYRYVGRSLAQAIHESGLTPREWLWRMYGS